MVQEDRAGVTRMDDRPASPLIAYRRVSTQRQGVSGLGLEAQEEAIARHSSMTGRPVIATYTEVESGRKSDRPELAKALAHARRARAALVIAKLDRLGRNVRFLASLMESGVPFVCCDNPHATPLTLHILAAVAEEETRMISERTRAALAAAKARGVKLGRDNLTVEGRARGLAQSARARSERAAADHAPILPLIRELHAAGSSQQAIADRLNTEGHLTRTGKPWHQVAVKRLLDRGK